MYEIRKFTQLAQKLVVFKSQQSFADIYLHRRGHTQIGIKFRQPKQKQYGWKLTNFQCKIAQVNKIQQGILMEKWDKYKFSLSNSIKFKIHGVSHTKQQQEKEQKLEQFDEQDKQQADMDATTKLKKKAFKIYKQVSKVLMKPQLNMKTQKIVSDWCSGSLEENAQTKHDIKNDLQVYVISKNKQKVGGIQRGLIRVERLINNPSVLYFQTECIQSKNPNKLKNKLIEWKYKNYSYPNLLEILMQNDTLFLHEGEEK